MLKKSYTFGPIYIALCGLFLAVTGYVYQTRVLHATDFKPLYAGARCLAHGCDPYDIVKLREQYDLAGGPQLPSLPFIPGNADYPPSTMFVLLPWALLPWREGHIAWLATIALTLTGAALCATDLCRPYAAKVVVPCLGGFLASSTLLMMFGQPAGVAIGTCGIAVWCLLKHKYTWAGVLLFSFSLVVKPQIGLLLLLFLLCSKQHRRRAVQIVLTAATLSATGLGWASLNPASRHWFRAMTANVADIARNGNQPGDSEAIFFTQLQGLFSLFWDNRLGYNLASWIIVGGLCAALLYVMRTRRPSSEGELCIMAAVASLTLLPIYHRNYDIRLIVLCFPATAVLMQRRRIYGVAALTLIALLTLVTSSAYTHFVQQSGLAAWNAANPLPAMLLGRSTPILLLALSVLLVVSAFGVSRDELAVDESGAAAGSYSKEQAFSSHTAS